MDSIPATSGVYKIVCIPTGKVYVGSAINLRSRYQDHWSALARNKHINRHLQSAWNKHGADNFRFDVIELVLSTFLTDREQYWFKSLDCCNSKRGFNIAPIAGSSLGIRRSDETKRRLSEVAKKRMSTPGARADVSRTHKGKTISPEQKAKWTAIAKGRPRPREATEAWALHRARHYIVTDPDGNIYTVYNLSAFCREYELLRRSMAAVAQGKLNHHKGWRCHYDD